MGTRAKRAGDLKRTVTCNFCGKQHRRKSRELRECRRRHRHGQGEATTATKRDAQARPGSATTRYQTDPLRGDKLAHAIAKKLRAGMAPRKVAKHLNLSLATVQAVARDLEQGERR
jgi:hypothetical protein